MFLNLYPGWFYNMDTHAHSLSNKALITGSDPEWKTNEGETEGDKQVGCHADVWRQRERRSATSQAVTQTTSSQLMLQLKPAMLGRWDRKERQENIHVAFNTNILNKFKVMFKVMTELLMQIHVRRVHNHTKRQVNRKCECVLYGSVKFWAFSEAYTFYVAAAQFSFSSRGDIWYVEP